MLGQRGFELNRIQLIVEPHQRHDGHFGLEVQKYAEAAGLKIEIDQRHALIQRSERQREVGRERGHADAADQADNGNDHATVATLGAPARFADFQQRARRPLPDRAA